MKIVCISDTHLTHMKGPLSIPDGDVLIHSGDATFDGTVPEIWDFNRWFSRLPHRHKIFVAGNHDWLFQKNQSGARSLLAPEIIYLEDSMTEIEGLKIYGSPWQPYFLGWAFNLHRGAEIREKWDKIPSGIDVLITHGPPAGILDNTPDGESVGCSDLRQAIARVKPKLHVFGHVHYGHGRMKLAGTEFVNASLCNENYRPVNAPVVVDL